MRSSPGSDAYGRCSDDFRDWHAAAALVACDPVTGPPHNSQPGGNMGDKSPKSIEQKKKQAAAEKQKQQSDAYTKSHPAPTVPGRKGK